MSAAANIPAFDLESADRDILEAYAAVCAGRAYLYAFDGTADLSAETRDEMERASETSVEREDGVTGNYATTIPGVVARLLLNMTGQCDRWIDKAVSEHGFLALYHEMGRLDGFDQQQVWAVHELLNIEWEQNLAAYVLVERNLTLTGDVRALSEPAAFRAGPADPDDERHAIQLAVEHLQDRLTDDSSSAIRKLVRTLTPDHAAFLRKVEIIIGEQVDDIAPWLARDTKFLIGRGAAKVGEVA